MGRAEDGEESSVRVDPFVESVELGAKEKERKGNSVSTGRTPLGRRRPSRRDSRPVDRLSFERSPPKKNSLLLRTRQVIARGCPSIQVRGSGSVPSEDLKSEQKQRKTRKQGATRTRGLY